MKVRLLKLGHAAKEVDVPAGATVEEAIKASCFETDGYAITVNGVGAMLSSPVSEGSVIALVPKVEGGRGWDGRKIEDEITGTDIEGMSAGY